MPELLTGQDAAFLAFEAPGRPMHVAALALLDVPDGAGPGFAESLGVELARRLWEIPRFRERLVRGRRPRWAPDLTADPARHVCVLQFPMASGSELFHRALADCFALPLDPERPLWEAFVLAGLDGGRRVGLLIKAHHAMVDGASGVAVLARLLEPDPSVPARPSPVQRVRPTEASAEPAPASPAIPARRSERRGPAQGLFDLARRLLRPTSRTSLNGKPALERQIATVTLAEAPLRASARAAGGSVNDALLAWVAGGVRRWADASGSLPQSFRLRGFCPTNTRQADDATLGNQLGAWIVDLPVGVGDPQARMAAAARATDHARDQGHSRGVELLARLSNWLPAFFPRWGMALAGRLRAFNLVVTHVRGPAQRLRMLGAPLVSLTALAPVFPNQRCSIAAFRYDGALHIGITGAWPDRREFARLVEALNQEARALGALAADDRAAAEAMPERSARSGS